MKTDENTPEQQCSLSQQISPTNHRTHSQCFYGDGQERNSLYRGPVKMLVCKFISAISWDPSSAHTFAISIIYYLIIIRNRTITEKLIHRKKKDLLAFYALSQIAWFHWCLASSNWQLQTTPLFYNDTFFKLLLFFFLSTDIFSSNSSAV